MIFFIRLKNGNSWNTEVSPVSRVMNFLCFIFQGRKFTFVNWEVLTLFSKMPYTTSGILLNSISSLWRIYPGALLMVDNTENSHSLWKVNRFLMVSVISLSDRENALSSVTSLGIKANIHRSLIQPMNALNPLIILGSGDIELNKANFQLESNS